VKNIFTLFLVGTTLIALASIAALAQDAKTPSLALRNVGNASHPSSPHPPTDGAWGLPSVPGTIIFYGGDTNFSDPNYEGYANENTLVVGTTSVYAAVTAPTGGKTIVSGVFFNNIALVEGVFDPKIGTYDVRRGLSEENCGTELASGSAPQTAVPTGRSGGDFVEYTTSVSFPKPLTAKGGTTYWFNETPQCTNTGDNACESQEYYFDNTTQQTNGVNANAQPPYQLYLNSSYFGYSCLNLCEGENKPACQWGSWGLFR
jgi:hypothetical protein